MAFACLIGTNKSIKTCVQESGLKPRTHNIMFLKVLSIVKLVGIPQAKASSQYHFVLKGIVNRKTCGDSSALKPYIARD